MLREVLPLEDSSETAIMDAQEPKSAAIEEKQQEPLPV